jgi:hypothetical protein
MQIFVEIVRVKYDVIQMYLEPIGAATFALAKSEEDKVSAQAIEVWTTLAEQEADLIQAGKPCLNMIQATHGVLIKLLLECI